MTENKRFVLEDEELQIGITDNGKYITIKECVNLLNKLVDENEHIKHLIKEAYQTERTHIGKNTLKQLMEAIQ